MRVDQKDAAPFFQLKWVVVVRRDRKEPVDNFFSAGSAGAVIPGRPEVGASISGRRRHDMKVRPGADYSSLYRRGTA